MADHPFSPAELEAIAAWLAESAPHDMQQRRLCAEQLEAEQAPRGLWLVDPVTKDLHTCAVRDTSTVGVKEIRCLSGSAGRFRRTFRSDLRAVSRFSGGLGQFACGGAASAGGRARQCPPV